MVIWFSTIYNVIPMKILIFLNKILLCVTTSIYRLKFIVVHLRSEIGSQCCNVQSDIVTQHRIDIDLTLINYVISYKSKHNSNIEIILINTQISRYVKIKIYIYELD